MTKQPTTKKPAGERLTVTLTEETMRLLRKQAYEMYENESAASLGAHIITQWVETEERAARAAREERVARADADRWLLIEEGKW